MNRSDHKRRLCHIDNKVLATYQEQVKPRFATTRSSAQQEVVHSAPMLVNAEALPEILTARELEALIRIDVKTIYRYVQQGLIPHLRMESNVRFPKHRVLRWLEERSFSPRPVNGNGARKRQ